MCGAEGEAAPVAAASDSGCLDHADSLAERCLPRASSLSPSPSLSLSLCWSFSLYLSLSLSPSVCVCVSLSLSFCLPTPFARPRVSERERVSE